MPDPNVSTIPKALRRSITIAAWALSLAALAASTAWLFAGSSFRLDLLANLGAQTLLLCLFVAGLIAFTRRWRALAVAVLACIVQLIPLVRHRAAFLPHSPGPAPTNGSVRFLHYNDSSLSDKQDVYAMMDRSNADIISILSPPVKMQFDVIYGPGLEDRFAGKLLRPWKPAPDSISTEISPGFVVSRWPLTPVDCSFVGRMADRFICGIVERPGSRFALIAVHPRSPRNQTRWNEGNATIEALVKLSRKLQADGLPVVTLADLNASPSGWRSREACAEGGLLRAKPLLYLGGTYPDVVPLNIRTGQTSSIGAMWPMSIAIDDALITPGIDVIAWGTLDHLKSEHRPVIIDLRIPSSPSSAANRIDR
jgi:hypothetical protein